MSGETSQSRNFYESISSFWPLDIQTAASLGDVSYFAKYDSGKLKSQLSQTNSSGWTPLMHACSRGHSLLVNFLLSSGASRGCKTNSGVTSLMLAVSSGDFSTVESVFDVANMEEKDYKKWTALFYAIYFTRDMCFNFLLKKGANVNVVDFQNETPLMMAIKLGRKTMVELILQSATNLDVVSFKQESAFMLANELGCPKIEAMINERYEYLKNGEQENNISSATKLGTSRHKNVPTIQQYFQTPLKQRKCPIKVGKSFSYSPGKAAISGSPNILTTPQWKLSLQRKCWSPQQKPGNSVEEFLKNLSLEKYWPMFRDEEVDYETLMTLNEENLRELGIV
ncbi:hypothetical protein RUM44_012083 [Polyplax serrata]|uniref:NAD(+) ADP-ribosyltransferase n=1 Tax=Polyplax serrata TaxID=468196 RepID=A0ABR1BCF6_POLSC